VSVPREYPTQCWSCLGEFDASTAIWCSCSAKSASKLCPFCFRCFCQADVEYRETFWRDAPEELKEERDILKGGAGSSGEALIRSNLLSTDQLVSALRWQKSRGGSLDDALVELGFVSRDNLELVVNRQAPAGTSTMDLSKGLVDASLVSAVSVELCFRKRILPISKEIIGEKEVLTLAMAGPTDVETIDQVQSLTNCRVIPLNASEKDILERLQDLFPKEVAALRADDHAASRPTPDSAARAPAAPPAKPVAAAAVTPPTRKPPPAPARAPRRGGGARSAAAAVRPTELIESDELVPEEIPSPPVVPAAGRATASTAAAPPDPDDSSSVLQSILAEAISKRTSLVQFEMRGSVLSLFFRIDGNQFRAKLPSSASAEGLTRAISALASVPAGDQPAAGRLSVKVGDRKIEVVVRRFHSPGGESFLLKIIERSDFLRPLADLGPSARDLERLRQVLALAHGLVVLSAPPHNGLETTRYSLMALLAGEGRRVLSVDAPQLVAIDGLRQQEVPFPHNAASCRAALAAVPGTEVVFLPEIQSPEMATLAIEAAAGCLVVASIQARRAAQTPAAILWHQVEGALLASRIKMIANQRLVRRTCEACRKPVQVTDRVLKMMGLTPDEALDLKVEQGAGCDRCGPLSPGYSGRVALFEILEATPEVSALIAAGGSPGEIEREARRAGMSPLRAACLALVGQGITSLEEFQKGNF